MSDPVVFIHGAWQGSWVWERLGGLLAARGLVCQAVDLPGNGTDATPPGKVDLDRYASHVLDVIHRWEEPASIVAHSGGGHVATAVAEARPERIARIVYLAGMMLPSGMSFKDLLDREDARGKGMIGIGDHLIWSDDRTTSRVPLEAAVDIFFHDAGPEAARQAAARLTPQPESGRAIAADWTADRFGRIPRFYVECTKDRSIDISLQRRMQELVPGAAVSSLDTGHAPQLSATENLVDVLLPFLTGERD